MAVSHGRASSPRPFSWRPGIRPEREPTCFCMPTSQTSSSAYPIVGTWLSPEKGPGWVLCEGQESPRHPELPEPCASVKMGHVETVHQGPESDSARPHCHFRSPHLALGAIWSLTLLAKVQLSEEPPSGKTGHRGGRLANG